MNELQGGHNPSGLAVTSLKLAMDTI
jgi:hypothetical protein